ncbi:MAG: decarboxylating 6-phosphogluconate dehydrogenase [Armatimonadetes bacterium]|nr:decarboxylating 6-phosphogluconate dehydrogenase [Armatimonadota bacterium]MDW8121960.1 decarboxylating 6-phosphogluconate dehydrogenase [Armatimonadota bacterium]
MDQAPYGFVGLGGMGSEVVRNLLDQGITPAVYNRTRSKTDALVREGAIGCYSLEELVHKLKKPRIIWMMLTAGKAVDDALFGGGAFGDGLVPHLEPGDVVIDGGNSYFRDSIRRHRALKERGIHFLDCGTSGGLEGSRNGPCLMIGGEAEAFERARPLFERLVRQTGGFAYVGPPGAGHFVKMVHNAIEYGILQCIGEGFELLRTGPKGENEEPLFRLDLAQIAELWCKGSVIRGWLMELAARAFRNDPDLSSLTGVIGGGSTGRWSIDEAWDAGVPFATIALSYALRHRSRQPDTFAGKVVAALRREFGGHPVVPAESRSGE